MIMMEILDCISGIIVESFAATLGDVYLRDEFQPSDHRVLSAVKDTTSQAMVAIIELSDGKLSLLLELFMQADECTDVLQMYNAMELVNQMAGRMSNQMYKLGMFFRLTPPHVMRSGEFESKRSFDNFKVFMTESYVGWRLKTIMGPMDQLEEAIKYGHETKGEVLSAGQIVIFDE
jgi:hypothetical protein